MDAALKAWLKIIVGTAVAAVVVLVLVQSGGSGDPSPCQSATDTPCLVSDATVRWIDLSGTYQFEDIATWRDERASAQQDQMDDQGGPPAGPYTGP